MKSTLEELKAEIEQLRDELKLKAHLGKAEARDELEKLENKIGGGADYVMTQPAFSWQPLEALSQTSNLGNQQ